jgi:HrpA-like RNA helicase
LLTHSIPPALLKHLIQALQATGTQMVLTEPRRVTTTTLANRMRRMNPAVQHRIGYKIRWEDDTDARTVLKLVTDGLLLAESISDNNLKKCSLIIIDEIHLRNTNTDLLLLQLTKVLASAQQTSNSLLIARLCLKGKISRCSS